MKKWLCFVLAALAAAASLGGCKALRTAADQKVTSQGAPYELIVVCRQPEWEGALGDTLRAVLTQPVMGVNQREPLFDVRRVFPAGFKNLIRRHRNILQTVVDPSLKEAEITVNYDVYASPQVLLSLQGPTVQSLIDYVSAHREELLLVLEKTERDRTIDYAHRFPEQSLTQLLREKFGVELLVPKGYRLRTQSDDFAWISYEFPQASQGFFIYTYPYTGPQQLTAAALTAARNKYAARIPGPSDGSYMITAEVYEPDYRTFTLAGRPWAELRGFWDVKNDFMGGPFVSYTTVDTARKQVFTIDCYVYSPKNPKRNYLRELEHLLYLIGFSAPEQAPAQGK